MNRKDCIFNNVVSCMALKSKQCEGCRFCKTREQQDESIEKAKKRCKKEGIEYGVPVRGSEK